MISTLEMANLTPRDLSGLVTFKQLGLSLVEVKISQVSFAKGMLLRNVRLPESTRLLCVIRKGKALLDLSPVFLEEQDTVYLLTDDEYAVRSAFTVT